MNKILEYFNPLTIIEKLITIGITLAIAAALVWWFNSKIRDHYQAPLIAEYKAANDEAIRIAAKRDSLNTETTKKAKDAKLKTLENLAADSKRLATANDRLQSDLRASTAAKTDLTACIQRADTLDTVQQAVRGFATRVVEQCDKHVADKIELRDAWPK